MKQPRDPLGFIVNAFFCLGAFLLLGSVAVLVLGFGFCGVYYAITGSDIIQTINLDRVAAGFIGTAGIGAVIFIGSCVWNEIR